MYSITRYGPHLESTPKSVTWTILGWLSRPSASLRGGTEPGIPACGTYAVERASLRKLLQFDVACTINKSHAALSQLPSIRYLPSSSDGPVSTQADRLGRAGPVVRRVRTTMKIGDSCEQLELTEKRMSGQL